MRLGIAVLVVGLASCGGGSGGTDFRPNPPRVPIVISPAQATVLQGETQQFSVSGAGVRWSVQEGAAGGSITTAGLYTAPTNGGGTFHVVATSQADSRRSATATVTVLDVFINIFPESDVLGPGGAREFGAQVSGAGDPRVTFAVLEGSAGGTINSSRYTAPDNTGIFHVVATSMADPRASATSTITVVSSGFRPAGDMIFPRTAHTATLLPNGQVLVAGGDPCFEYSQIHGPDGDPCPLEETELFDSSNGIFVRTGNMFAKRATHAATLLPNGRVLMTGGGSANAELYEPISGAFVQNGSMSVDRSAHTATLLTNGKVLVAGGATGSSILATAEIYDPQTGTFSATLGGVMKGFRSFHTATRLQNGMVLFVGGFGHDDEPQATAELYDPVTESFAATGSMSRVRARHTATLLENGTVLVAAGILQLSGRPRDAEIYDPASGTFNAIIPMETPSRESHFAVTLPDGKVLVSGGEFFCCTLFGFTAEIYDPAAGSFTQTGGMLSLSRILPAAVALTDGRVLVTGGTRQSSAEIYQ